MSTRIALGYPAMMATLGAAMVAAPDLAVPLWVIIGALTVAAMLYGTWHHAPYRRSPWWLLAGGVAAMAVGDALYATGDRPDGGIVGLADACYLGMIPLIAAGLLGMSRSSTVLADRSRMIDLLTFSCAAALATWVTLLGPTLTTALLTGVERFALTAYVLGALLVLITTVRLAVAATLSWSIVMLVGGAGALLAGDALYAVAVLDESWRPGGPDEVAYLIFYFAWGAAALHPSMAALTDPVNTWPTRLRVRSAALLTGSMAVPSILLFMESAGGQVRDAGLIGAASLVMLVLVLIRLTDAIGHYRRSLIRERALRQACGALVAATDAEQVGTAARTAVATLLPAGHPYEAAIVRGGGPLPSMPADRRTRLIDAALLDPNTVEGLAGHESALVCPLDLSGRPTGEGALVVAASRLDLVTTRNAIEVLAAQAAQALERISLTETMNRRDGDRYLRAVVRNTTDVVLVVEPSGHIRYASPSLATVIGVDPAALPSLHDLVDSDDHARMAELLDRADTDGTRDVWNLLRDDGGRATVEVNCRDLRGDPLVRGFVITLHDITESRRMEREHIRQALESSPAGQNRQSSTTKYR